MKITKHGKKYESKSANEAFTCENCGCEFTVKDGEYYTDYNAENNHNSISLTYTISYMAKDYLVCSCPECYKIVKKIREREIPSITCTGSIKLNDIQGTLTSSNKNGEPTL